jgi:hypothetical protein
MRGLDERVPDAVAHGHAAGARDLLLHDPRGAQVVDDRRARVLLQDLAREQRRHQVVPTVRPVSSTKQQRSASPSKPTPSSACVAHERAHGIEVLLLERVGLVVRERAVELGEDRCARATARHALEDRPAACSPPCRWRSRSRS